MALQFLLGVSAFSCMAIAALLAERRQAMERLVEEHQFNEQIFRSAREGVIVYGPDRAIQAWNPFMEQLSGVTASEAIGCQPMELFPFLSEVGFGERLDKVLAGEPVETIDFPFQVPWTGRCGWASDASAPFLDSKGAIVGVIATVRDITERRQTEAEKAVLQAQLQQSQKLESLGTLAGGVAHDMNNVLGAILSLASAHETLHPQGSPVHQAFTTIAEAATRGGKMVRSLLTFARQQPAEEQVLDLNALLRQNLDLLEHTTLARVRLVTEFAPDLLPVKGDPGALVSGFMNLCVNAVDAMPANGTLTLRTRNLAGGWVEAVVEDTGTGMPKEVLDKALDPFFTTKEVGKGTGLGLSMVFSTVKAHGGELAIRSEPGQGTQVTVRFPVSV
jgi:PAS domain S-box-containing protein